MGGSSRNTQGSEEMKLDVGLLRYMSSEEFRVLTAVEMGMRNHDTVPTQIIASIANLKHGGAFKILRVLLRNKLVSHTSIPYDGYRLSYSGYDYLALRALVSRGVVAAVGSQVGVGKESDVFMCSSPEGKCYILKVHRLGRVCFRAVKTKRDYLQHRRSAANWLYLSRLAALKEFSYMKVLGEHGFPVPQAIDWNRHCVVMTIANGFPFSQIRSLRHPGKVFHQLMEVMIRLANYGLIHCDFNEFNLLISEDEQITLIDFPQMVSIRHLNAEHLFNRDVECLRLYFSRKYGFEPENTPSLVKDVSRIEDVMLDKQVMASGWTTELENQFQALAQAQQAELTSGDVIDVTNDDVQGLPTLDADPTEPADLGDDDNDDGDATGASNDDDDDDDDGNDDGDDGADSDVSVEETGLSDVRVHLAKTGLNRGRSDSEDSLDMNMGAQVIEEPGVDKRANDAADDTATGRVWRGHRNKERKDKEGDDTQDAADSGKKSNPSQGFAKQRTTTISKVEVVNKVKASMQKQRPATRQKRSAKQRTRKAHQQEITHAW
eukprot:c8427_g1_i1.p1 GENE.c8427_g1_i1~~c8427_g1_i1.p1  ORF type:complete len:548 (-),score=126.36 c8427_g1_i1:148-1791(-)